MDSVDNSEEVHIEGEVEEPPRKQAKTKTPTRIRPARLPLGRIKQIIKMDPDVVMASADAVFLITKATELFVESLSKDSYANLATTKMKTILGRHVDAAISGSDALVFLEGALDL